MDPNALPSTSQTATTSTSTESHLKHLSSHDVAVFGASCDLSLLNLPTKQDILRCFFFLAERAKLQNKMFSYKTFVPHVTDKLIEIWSQLNVEIVRKTSVARKLGTLIDKYQIETKHQKIATFRTFVQSTKELFYIGKCQCDLKAALCSCGLIPDHLKEFMRDQNNVRRLTIPEFVPEVEEPALTSVEETHLAYESSTDTDEPMPDGAKPPKTPRPDVMSTRTATTTFSNQLDFQDADFEPDIDDDKSKPLTQNEMNYVVAKIGLSERKAEFLASFLKSRKLTERTVSASSYRSRRTESDHDLEPPPKIFKR